MRNPSKCSCEYDKYCEIGQYLNHENCVYRKKVTNHLIEQCNSTVDIEIKNNTLSEKNNSNDNTYLILFIVFLELFVVFLIGFIYYCWRRNADKKIKRFHLSKSRNFDLLNYKNGSQIIKNKYKT